MNSCKVSIATYGLRYIKNFYFLLITKQFQSYLIHQNYSTIIVFASDSINHKTLVTVNNLLFEVLLFLLRCQKTEVTGKT